MSGIVLEKGVKDVALVRATDPMLQILELASNPAMDVDKLQRLIDMRKDAMRENGIAAFNAAFTRMQAELPTVIERSRTDKYSYAALEDIVDAVRPVLSRHGFGLSHRTEFQPDGRLKVVGILTHEQGHSRESEFISLPDVGPARNAIQALGSANQYARRYTTKDLLNIVTRGEDDDARAAGRKQAPAVKVPEGFESWQDDLAATAAHGLKALEAVWKASKPEYRLHMRNTNADGWERLKADAGKVTA